MMMPYKCDPNSAGDLAINKMIGKAVKIDAMKAGFDLMKAVRVCGRQRNHSAQLHFEFISQLLRNYVVAF